MKLTVLKDKNYLNCELEKRLSEIRYKLSEWRYEAYIDLLNIDLLNLNLKMDNLYSELTGNSGSIDLVELEKYTEQSVKFARERKIEIKKLTEAIMDFVNMQL